LLSGPKLNHQTKIHREVGRAKDLSAPHSIPCKLHLFRPTQRRFILIHTAVTLTCVLLVLACSKAILRHVNTRTLQGRCNKNLRDRPTVDSHYF
jgi:hypothetical protein